MSNSNESIHPVAPSFIGDRGLTKREYFAAMAIQGFSSIPYTSGDNEEMCAKTDARRAVMAADALLKELDK